jgi:hypothetical protein
MRTILMGLLCLSFFAVINDGVSAKSKTETKSPSPDKIQKMLNSIPAVAPYPGKDAWVRYDTLSRSGSQFIGRFAPSAAEACAGTTPFTSFPDDKSWQSPIHGMDCQFFFTIHAILKN